MYENKIFVNVNSIFFIADTDAMFGGVTAFPESSTIVTGLKYKKKYQGFKAIDKFPDTIRDNF